MKEVLRAKNLDKNYQPKKKRKPYSSPQKDRILELENTVSNLEKRIDNLQDFIRDRIVGIK